MARAVNRLQAIKDRLSAATPGPWRHFVIEGTLAAQWVMFKHGVLSENGDLRLSLPESHTTDGRAWPCAATAELIAHSRDDLEWAVGEIERLRSLAQLVVERPEGI
jgi:hypothetical protein